MFNFLIIHWSSHLKVSTMARQSFSTYAYCCLVGVRLLELYGKGCKEDSLGVLLLCCLLGCKRAALRL